ncbi:MAG: response regulator [Verrucomicrobiota bacterium]|jgi:DNA-binding response OmpR family regulator
MKEIKIPQAGEPAGAPDKPNPPLRILVVEDDGDTRRLNAEVLIQSGYEVDAVEDGAVAWDELQVNSYDLLVTDHSMPKLSGLELLKKLHAAHMTLPVIMATGTMPAWEFALHPWLLPAAVLIKPHTVDELLGTVKKVLCEANGTAPGSQPGDMKDNKIPQDGESAGALLQPQTNSSQRILVVDDDPNLRLLNSEILIRHGYEVNTAEDGAAAWDELQDNNYDLIITDNKMPRMTGIEMIEKLRSAGMALPVIMATAELPMHEFARKPWLKPDAMLPRPFPNDDLLAAVKKVLRADDGNDGHKKTPLSKHA